MQSKDTELAVLKARLDQAVSRHDKEVQQVQEQVAAAQSSAGQEVAKAEARAAALAKVRQRC